MKLGRNFASQPIESTEKKYFLNKMKISLS